MFGFESKRASANQAKVKEILRAQYARDALEQKIDAIVAKHIKTLGRKRLELLFEDDYGVIDTKAWSNEVRLFYTKVILPALTADDVKVAVTLGGTYIATQWIELPASLEAERLAKSVGSTKDVDSLDPLEYEKYCAALVEKAGWKCKTTPATGDQGADVLATKGGKTLVLQCKKYSANVGNSAVQEAVSAKLHFRATHAAVVTNAGFTRSAKQLANTTQVLLLSHVQLLEIDSLTD